MSRPTGDAKEEIKRILAAKSHYAVLEVDSSAKEDTIKRARRMKSLVVHPDKVGPDVIGANEAFMKVTQVHIPYYDYLKECAVLCCAACFWHKFLDNSASSLTHLVPCTSLAPLSEGVKMHACIYGTMEQYCQTQQFEPSNCKAGSMNK